MPELSRRRVLMGGTAIGAGALTYATDNPLHRSTVETTATRSADDTLTDGDVWTTASTPDAPDTDLAQFLVIRYIESSFEGADFPKSEGGEKVGVFSVLAVAVGHRSSLFRTRPLLGTHRLGVRSVGDSGMTGPFSGDSDNIASGVVQPPRRVTDLTGFDRSALNDPDVVREQIPPYGGSEFAGDLALAQALFEQSDIGETVAADRLTLAGVVNALQSNTTTPLDDTSRYEERGRMFQWQLDGVVAHAVRINNLIVQPSGDQPLSLKVASIVPRSSLLGSPWFESALVVSAPL